MKPGAGQVTVAGGLRGLQGQRAGSDDGRHSFGSCCPEDVAVECRLPWESDPRPRGLHPVQSDDARSIITSVWGGAWVRWSWEYPPSFPELFKAVVGGEGGRGAELFKWGWGGSGGWISDKFQLSMSYENVEAPVPVHRQSGGLFQLCSSDVYPQCKLC